MNNLIQNNSILIKSIMPLFDNLNIYIKIVKIKKLKESIIEFLAFMLVLPVLIPLCIIGFIIKCALSNKSHKRQGSNYQYSYRDDDDFVDELGNAFIEYKHMILQRK